MDERMSKSGWIVAAPPFLVGLAEPGEHGFAARKS
jgi:hypothetical protein